MIHWLVMEKGFTEKGAKKCMENFLATMAFVAAEEIRLAKRNHPEWFKTQ